MHVHPGSQRRTRLTLLRGVSASRYNPVHRTGNGAAVDLGKYIKQRVIPEGMSVTEAAKKLGVGRPALSNLLNGRASLSPTMALRLERVFHANQEQLLDLQAQADRDRTFEESREIPMNTYAPRFLSDDITARRISEWAAGNIAARDQLPVLLRVLINSTGRDLSQVVFPGGDNAQRQGWDGRVNAAAATPWIPEGQSGWELSTTQRPVVKANRDYAARLAVDAAERAACTFVFVTACNWPGKDDWARSKQALGDWKAVRAYDASDLEHWLEASIPGQVWLAKELGMPTSGVETLDHWLVGVGRSQRAANDRRNLRAVCRCSWREIPAVVG